MRTANSTRQIGNPKLAPERRTKDLLARMTLEEKAAQMICIWQQKAETLVDADGQFDPSDREPEARAGEKNEGPIGTDDSGGKGRADDLHLAAEGGDIGRCGRPIRPVESQSRIQERPWAWAGGPTQRRREGPGCAPDGRGG